MRSICPDVHRWTELLGASAVSLFQLPTSSTPNTSDHPNKIILRPHITYLRAMHTAFLHESIRRLNEGRERIQHCLSLLDAEELLHRPNDNVVSVTNLVLHLCGNVGQWINATLGETIDLRDRDKEFALRSVIPATQLLNRLNETLDEAVNVIAGLSEDDLEKVYGVQGFRESGTGIVLHVVEHFSYHVGQITLLTKLMRNVDTGYYADQDLAAKG